MIIRKNEVEVSKYDLENALSVFGKKDLFEDSVFFDLEHYVYKKPICIGVFGCSYYDKENNVIKVTQYMLENRNESIEILEMAREYFKEMQEKNKKKYIVTFSGNNDFTVINYLFEKNNIGYDIDSYYKKIDLQREYEKVIGVNIGLKNLEKKFNIEREDNVISGSNLAKTFCKVMKDSDYMNRMPQEKKDRILLYNEQDVVSLFRIYVDWNSVVNEKLKQEELELKKINKMNKRKPETNS
ncbi:ribonuclease H-like domain-containing protein [Clostridium sediminicola]|uniref:ribonuclease H-like domain-containing protein n=1 Tax=Clostridium sediminicola TaxID=3114879 RepID=UPI0031F20FA9